MSDAKHVLLTQFIAFGTEQHNHDRPRDGYDEILQSILMPAYVPHERGVVGRNLGRRTDVTMGFVEVEVADAKTREIPSICRAMRNASLCEEVRSAGTNS